MKRAVKLAMSCGVHAGDRLFNLLRGLAGRPHSTRVIALYYHAVRLEHRERFGRQLDELLRFARPFLLDDGPLPGTPGLHVAITFDDGFASVVEHALPELQRRNIPCSIFVPTGCLGQRPSWIQDPSHPSYHERVLTVAEIADLAKGRGICVGSHSVTHARLSDVDPETAEWEMRHSKEVLEGVLGRAVCTFSYPHGARTSRLDEMARGIGYRRVLTIDPAPLTPFGVGFVAGRVGAEPSDAPIEFRLKAQGAYRWLSKSLRGIER